MLLGRMVFSHLLNDYSTKTMANENQWTILRIFLLLFFKDLRKKSVVGTSNYLFTFIVQSCEQLFSA